MDLTALFGDIAIGLNAAVSLTNLGYCLLGVTLGMLVGVIPGIGALSAISLLFPITFHLEPTAALIMLAGIFYGTGYGGSTAAILLNVPGTASSAVSCIDGYPMAQQGRGGIALLLTSTSSFIAGSIGILVMMLFSPLIASFALRFGSAEYFGLMVLGLVAASTMSDAPPAKNLAMVTLGIIFGVVGLDMYTGTERFTFGSLELSGGIGLVSLAIGLFGISEVIASVRGATPKRVEKVTFRSMVPTRDDVRRSWMPTLRGAGIGSFFGTLPGTGPTIAAFMSYAVEKKVAADPSRFGKGAIEGVCGPEAANNAADQTAFIPTLTLGIPGSATMALLIGVLYVHGLTPGPLLISERPDLFWGLVMSFWIGNVILLILNIPLIGIWVRILQVPYHLLYPAIVIFICVGVYSIDNSPYDVAMVAVFGVLGWFLRLLEFPLPPMLLGFILGPLMEEHFRRALILSRGELATFFESPISLTVMLITAALLLRSVWVSIRGRASRGDPAASA